MILYHLRNHCTRQLRAFNGSNVELSLEWSLWLLESGSGGPGLPSGSHANQLISKRSTIYPSKLRQYSGTHLRYHRDPRTRYFVLNTYFYGSECTAYYTSPAAIT